MTTFPSTGLVARNSAGSRKSVGPAHSGSQLGAEKLLLGMFMTFQDGLVFFNPRGMWWCASSRQACLSHRYLDSRIGGWQCYLASRNSRDNCYLSRNQFQKLGPGLKMSQKERGGSSSGPPPENLNQVKERLVSENHTVFRMIGTRWFLMLPSTFWWPIRRKHWSR